MRSTKAIINLENLRSNFQAIRSYIKNDVKLCAAVKADAYGHGAVRIAKSLESYGIDFLAVAAVSEGVELRIADVKIPILVLSLCTPEEVPEVIQNNLTPLVFDEEYISLFEKEAKALSVHNFSVHLAVDTGMGRIGCLPENAAKTAQYIASCPHLKLCGVCTHFAAADSISEENKAYTKMQFALFNKACKAISGAGINPGIRHCSSSAALFDLPQTHLDMVRPGIITYGYYPDQITSAYLEKKGTPVSLKPVMTFETTVVAIRPFKKGESISYGHTWTAEKDTDIAVLPVGYADGLLRRFSPGLCVAINGKPYPVRGRICMDQCMVDIGKNNQNVKRWDKAVIFGDTKEGALQNADDLARQIGTISYEVMTGLTKRVPRVYC